MVSQSTSSLSKGTPPFWVFHTRLSPKAARVELKRSGTREECGLEIPDPRKLLRGEFDSIPMPVEFVQRSGNVFGDVLDTSSAILFLISDRFVNALESEGLSGWGRFNVEITKKNGEHVSGYHGLYVTGRSGPIDLSNSIRVKKRVVNDGPISNYYLGLNVRPDQWDGSDFFLPQGHFGIFISQRAAEALSNGKFSNLFLQDSTKIEIDEVAAQVINRRSNAFS
ncbi:MAG: hypothetical protein IPM21_06650 [Acidobacteria bacterium]|nr:hypothetical protein [Acidobacteriota bacterium]